MFKKLFGRKQTPTNDGKSTSSQEVEGTSLVKSFFLELSNMEGKPTYKLTHQLTVGSEVGNIVIADPSVSARHCTFVLQDEVVSVLDHGSVGGTFINGKKIPAGRYIILEETDNIRIGDLEVQIHIKNESIKSTQDTEAEEPEEEIEEEVEDEAEQEVEDEVEEENEVQNPKVSFLKKWFGRKSDKEQEVIAQDDYRRTHKKEFVKEERKTKALSFASNSPYATNAIVRVLAVISDLIIAYSFYIILAPFDEFRNFVSDVPALLGGLLDVDWTALWTTFNEDYAFIGEALKDLYAFSSATFNLGPLILLFILVRLISTLIFGISISEAFLGVRSHGNAVWKRIGGMLRVLIGIITGPFLIFDIPAIVSRRTFKEFMTFTHTYVASKFLTILGLILYMPLLCAFALLAPLIQGFELPEPIAVNDKPERRIKLVQPTDAQVEIVKTKDASKFLNMEIEYDGQNISLIPFFKFTEVKRKLNYNPSIEFYHKDLQRSVRMEVFKTFNFKELLSIGLKGDFILQERFPQLSNYIHTDGLTSVFKSKKIELDNRKFADEFVAFTKVAFELNAEQALDIMQLYTPYLKGLLDYKASLLNLIEYKKMDQVDFIKMGNAYFLRISYMTIKPFDLIIPLIQGEGKILRVEFDKKIELGVLRNKFYKFTLDQTNWFPDNIVAPEGETLKPLQVLDFFAKLDVKGDKVDSDKAQALYGYYFEKSAEILKKEDSVEYEIWKKSVEAIYKIMENMRDSTPKAVVSTEPVAEPSVSETTDPAATVTTPVPVEPEAPVDDPRMKLFQNFQDLKDALENKNKEFFAVEESINV